MGFVIIESGDESLPWAIWDALEGMPVDHFASRLEAAEALVRIEWEIRHGR